MFQLICCENQYLDVKSKENPQDLQLIGNKPPPNASSDAKPSNWNQIPQAKIYYHVVLTRTLVKSA